MHHFQVLDFTLARLRITLEWFMHFGSFLFTIKVESLHEISNNYSSNFVSFRLNFKISDLDSTVNKMQILDYIFVGIKLPFVFGEFNMEISNKTAVFIKQLKQNYL